MMAMPPLWRKPYGVRAVVIETFSVPRSALGLAPGLCSIAASITAAPEPQRRAATLPSTTAARGARAASWVASKLSHPGLRSLDELPKKSLLAASSAVLEFAGGHLDAITSEMVGRACVAGDLLAKEVLQETTMFLTVWLGNIVDLLEPDVMIVGGGAAPMLEPFFGEIRDRLPNWCVNSHGQEIPLVTAHYGTDAGIAGGAALCL